MISREYMERLGLTEDQITSLMGALDKESYFRKLLERERVQHSEAIVRVTDLEKVDFSNEDLLREKIRIEYKDMIPSNWKGSNVQIWGSKKQYQK